VQYLLEKKFLKVNALLTITCAIVLFQFGWTIMQMFNIDPIFYPVSTTGARMSVRMPLVGWSGNTAVLGTFLAINAFLLLHYFRIKKVPIFFFIILSSVFFLNNATTALCFGAGGLFYFFNRYKFKRKYLLIAIALILCLATFFIYYKPPNFDRLPIWKQLFTDGIKIRPFVGSGINFFAFLQIVDKYGVPWGEAHNDYLQIILELGLIGFILFIAFIISKFVRFFKSEKTHLQITIATCLVAYLVAGISLFPMRLAQLSFYAIILFACLEASYVSSSTGTNSAYELFTKAQTN